MDSLWKNHHGSSHQALSGNCPNVRPVRLVENSRVSGLQDHRHRARKIALMEFEMIPVSWYKDQKARFLGLGH